MNIPIDVKIRKCSACVMTKSLGRRNGCDEVYRQPEQKDFCALSTDRKLDNVINTPTASAAVTISRVPVLYELQTTTSRLIV